VVTVSLSFGVTERQIGGDAVVAMIERADTALYQAKNSGRNCCVAFSQGSGQLDREVA